MLKDKERIKHYDILLQFDLMTIKKYFGKCLEFMKSSSRPSMFLHQKVARQKCCTDFVSTVKMYNTYV